MINKTIRILFVCPNSSMGGDSQSFLDMMSSLKDYIEPIVLMGSVGPFTEECKARGYRYIVHSFADIAWYRNTKHTLIKPWTERHFKYFVKDFLCIRYLRKVLQKGDIDLVNSNVSGSTIGCQIAREWNVPHVWHIREALDMFFTKDVCCGFSRLKRLINNADTRVAISNAIKEHHEMKEEGTFVINDAVRSKSDACYEPKKEKYILFTGGCSQSKGSLLVVKAFGLSRLFKEGFKLKIIGGQDPIVREKMLDIAKEFDFSDNIELLPFQKDVKPFFAHASAFVQGSVYEGLGRTTVEAMFFGCPVIATAYSGGTLDIVKDKETGYLFNTPEQCASLLRMVCSTDQTEMIMNAQKFVTNRFTPEVYAPKMLEVYKYALENYKK